MTIRLAHLPGRGGYRLGNTKLMAAHDSDGCWRVMWLRPSEGEWAERNRQLFQQSFPRLKDLKETVAAVMAVDPPPPVVLMDGPDPDLKMTRTAAGKHQLVVRSRFGEVRGSVQRSPSGLWTLLNTDGRKLGNMLTLAQVARQAGHRLLVDYHASQA